MTRRWKICMSGRELCLSHKSLAREVTRELGWGVFWEAEGEGEDDWRAIFVGKFPGGVRGVRVGTRQPAEPWILRLAKKAAALDAEGRPLEAVACLQPYLL